MQAVLFDAFGTLCHIHDKGLFMIEKFLHIKNVGRFQNFKAKGDT